MGGEPMDKDLMEKQILQMVTHEIEGIERANEIAKLKWLFGKAPSPIAWGKKPNAVDWKDGEEDREDGKS